MQEFKACLEECNCCEPPKFEITYKRGVWAVIHEINDNKLFAIGHIPSGSIINIFNSHEEMIKLCRLLSEIDLDFCKNYPFGKILRNEDMVIFDKILDKFFGKRFPSGILLILNIEENTKDNPKC